MVQLPSILKHWKGECHILWRTPTSHIYINPWKFMGSNCHPSGNNWILSPHAYKCSLIIEPPILASPSSTYLVLPTNIIHYLLSKYLKNIPNLIMIKTDKCPPSVQNLYHFWNYDIPKTFFSMLNTFNSGQNYHVGRYAYELMHPLSCIQWVPYFWHCNDTPSYICKADRIAKNNYWAIFFNKTITIKDKWMLTKI